MKITDKILSAWIDEGLSPKKMKIVEDAIQSDAQLQARVEALRSVGNALRKESFEVPVSAERMAADVCRQIRLQKPAPVRWFPVWLRAGLATCACLTLAVLLLPQMINNGTQVLPTEIESVNSGLSGVSTMVYTDYDAGWTIVWLEGAELEPGS